MGDQFIRTSPDYGSPQSSLISPDIDIGELAARINRNLLYRREGRILHYTDFSPSMNGWNTSFSTVYVSTHMPLIGSGALAMDGIDPTQLAATITLPVVTTGKYGLSTYVMWDFYVAPHAIISMQYFDGTNGHRARYRFKFDTGEIQYINSSNVWTTMATITDLVSPETYISMKMIVDWENKKYVNLQWNGELLELPVAVYTYSAPAVPPCFTFGLLGEGQGATQFWLSWASAIITMNESV